MFEKSEDRKIVGLTCYDFSMASALDPLGLDFILVGDSMAMTMFGEKNTHNVRLEEMLPLARGVKRACELTPVIFDMPQGTYDNAEIALRNAKWVKNGTGIDVLKLEGRPDMVKVLVDAGFQVMGHSGLKPQTALSYKVVGKGEGEFKDLKDEVLALEKAGVFAVVLECLPADLAKQMTALLSIPTIGIGAGVHCDGQILVLQDMLGLYDAINPRFVRKYADMKSVISASVKDYISTVRKEEFPNENESY